MKLRLLVLFAAVLTIGFFLYRHYSEPPAVTVDPVPSAAVLVPPEISAASAAKTGQVPRAIAEPMPVIQEDAPAPVLIGKGQFRPVMDEGHDVSGWVMLYRLADQSYLVRIESLWMEGAPPPLDVVLVRSPSPRSGADVQGALLAGPLKETSGDMNYPMAQETLSEVHGLALVVRGKHLLYAGAPFTPSAQ